MSNWIIRHNVPVLDEHILRDEDGEELVQIDQKKLQLIADRNNRRVYETGDMVPLVIGHTKDEGPEHEQPEVVGYACNFKVRPFLKTGRKAVTATFKFFKDKIAKIRNFPRRSVELWLSDWKLDPIALLGATTPERDLGLLQLSSTGKKKLRRILYEKQPMPAMAPGKPCAPGQACDTGEPNPQDNSPQSVVDAVVGALQQTDVWKWIEQQMQNEQAAAMQPDMGMDGMGMDGLPPEAGMGMEGPPPPEGDFGDDGGYEDEPEDDPEDEEDDEDEPERYGAAYSSGTNTFTPSGANDRAGYPGSMRQRMSRPTQPVQRRPQNPVNPPRLPSRQAARPVRYSQVDPQYRPDPRQVLAQRVRMAADQRRGELARIDQAFQSLAEENQNLRVRFQRADREKDLIQLESEGYLFDRIEELDYVTELPDEQYARHLRTIRKRYQRAPIGGASFSSEALRSGGPKGQRSGDRAKEIAQYAAQKGISYASALEELGEE